MTAPGWVGDDDVALLTDLYQLTMLQAYVEEGMHGEAVFDLFVRRLPERRNFLVACGLESVLRYLERLRFTGAALETLRGLGHFSEPFLEWLRAFRFEGDVHAVPEGTVVFANEPLLEVVAPVAQAQLVETFVLNRINFETLMASKAARVALAAAGREVVDFGLRRMQGTDSAVRAARAMYLGGLDATSNVLAGATYGIPVAGTMAHSYVEAHDDEREAFRAFAAIYPGTVLLVDTYDTLAGVRRVIDLARTLGDAFDVGGIRLDSGDLGGLAREARALLDGAGLGHVRIFASGSLDEDAIAALVAAGAPIDAFGVGSRLGTSEDVPFLDAAYKLVAYGGRGRIKLSEGKTTLPGRKQVFRFGEGTERLRDLVALHEEVHEARPLLRAVMRRGRRLPEGTEPLATIRARAAAEIAALPAPLRMLAPATTPVPVEVSGALRAEYDRLRAEIAAAQAAGGAG